MRSPFARARSTKPSTRARWSGWIERRDRGRIVAGIAEHLGVNPGVEPFEEGAGDRLLHQQPGAGQTHLTGIVVLPGGLGGGGVDVGVREHDQRPLAAELGGERNDVGCGRRADRAARLGRAGEADAAQTRVGDERGARFLADSLQRR